VFFTAGGQSGFAACPPPETAQIRPISKLIGLDTERFQGVLNNYKKKKASAFDQMGYILLPRFSNALI